MSSYASTPDPYMNTATGVLMNLLGITSREELESAEADLTAAIIASIPDESASGNFDLDHLKNIHWELFHSIYSWAGEIRVVEIGKAKTRFAYSAIIEQAAQELFSKLHTQRLLKDLARDEYAASLAHYYSEINILHPFREGNGRTERVFFSQLAAGAGYRLAWERMKAHENRDVCIAAYNGDERPLAVMLDKLLETSHG
jgi:cell filamentation protein